MAPEEVAERLQKLPGGATAPLNVHLRQEVDRLNIVLRITRETLESLRLAIAGGYRPLSSLDATSSCSRLPWTNQGGTAQGACWRLSLSDTVDYENLSRGCCTVCSVAFAGTIALSAQLNEALDALYAARIPAAWVRRSWQVSAVQLAEHQRSVGTVLRFVCHCMHDSVSAVQRAVTFF